MHLEELRAEEVLNWFGRWAEALALSLRSTTERPFDEVPHEGWNTSASLQHVCADQPSPPAQQQSIPPKE